MINQTGSSSGPTPFERLTRAQIDAAAETLWEFAWHSDPNSPRGEEWANASKVARDNYREWARAVLLAGETGKVMHTWYQSFPRMEHEGH